ncbi:MAG: hypothetical protein ABSA48_00655 [Terracidiphilus sp.]|jgi:hypothetical protein
MSESPITKTMDEMLGKLKDAVKTRKEAEKQITEYTSAIRALAKVIEDKEIGDSYLANLDELSGKPGFLDSVRSVLRFRKEGATPTEIRSWIHIGKKMDLSVYSNPMSSIHTTIRRMVDSGEVEPFENAKGEKAYRLKAAGGGIPPPPAPINAPAPPSSGGITPPPRASRTSTEG